MFHRLFIGTSGSSNPWEVVPWYNPANIDSLVDFNGEEQIFNNMLAGDYQDTTKFDENTR